MSAPAKRTVPESGRRLPASWPMKVVLPAPFGPITACVSPSTTSKSMPSLARSAPKVLDNFSTVRMLFIVAEQNARQPATEENHREHEQRPEHHHPVLGPRLEDFFQDKERECADHRTGGGR